MTDASRWYHASPHVFGPGDPVEPGHPPAYSAHRQDHVYLTTSLRNARQWAASAEAGPDHVYEVTAPGRYEPDPNPTGAREYRTRESVRVVGEPPPGPAARPAASPNLARPARPGASPARPAGTPSRARA